MLAAQNGHPEAVEVLLDSGACIEDFNKDGNSAVILAHFNGHEDVVTVAFGKGRGPRVSHERGYG